MKKAKTPRFFDMNTGEIGRLSQPGGALYNIEHSNDGLITFPGGMPIEDGNGEIIGNVKRSFPRASSQVTADAPAAATTYWPLIQ